MRSVTEILRLGMNPTAPEMVNCVIASAHQTRLFHAWLMNDALVSPLSHLQAYFYGEIKMINNLVLSRSFSLRTPQNLILHTTDNHVDFFLTWLKMDSACRPNTQLLVYGIDDLTNQYWERNSRMRQTFSGCPINS